MRQFSLVFLLHFAICKGAWANIVGNDTQNFNPTTNGIDFVTVQSTETLNPGVANFGYFIDGARNVLPATKDGAGNFVYSHDLLIFQDFNFGLGLLENVDAGVNVSALALQTTDREDSGAQYTKAGLDEVRANIKWRILPRKHVGIAAIFSGNFNQVKNNPFIGQGGGATWNLELAADATFWDYMIAGNIGYRARNPGKQLEDSLFSPLSNQFIASGALSRYLPEWRTKLIAEMYAARPISPSDAPKSSSLSSEILFGGKYDWSQNIAIDVGASRKFHDGLFSPDYRLYAGLNWDFEMTPKQSSSTSTVSHHAIKKNFLTGDQPGEIEAMSKVPFDEIAHQKEFILRKSVSDTAINEEKPPFETVLLDGIDFDFGSSDVLPIHRPMMNRLVAYLNSKPKVIKIRIEGHTDSIGSYESNQRRSVGRAKSVRDYLLKNGIDREIELESVGYGAEKPIADNGNFQGRRQNRRVEVRVLRRLSASKSDVEALP